MPTTVKVAVKALFGDALHLVSSTVCTHDAIHLCAVCLCLSDTAVGCSQLPATASQLRCTCSSFYAAHAHAQGRLTLARGGPGMDDRTSGGGGATGILLASLSNGREKDKQDARERAHLLHMADEDGAQRASSSKSFWP